MELIIAWSIVLFAFVLPLGHVAFTKDMMPAPDASTCPFSPRMGWIVMVIFLGPLGWLLFMHARARKRKAARSSPNS